MTRRVPVIPRGWPRAMAPPFTLRILGLIAPSLVFLPSSSFANFSESKALMLAMTWAAKASLISIRSKSFISRLVSFSSLAVAKAGPRPILSGSHPA